MTDTPAPTTPREELHAMLRSAVGPVKGFGWQVDQLLDRIIEAEARATPTEALDEILLRYVNLPFDQQAAIECRNAILAARATPAEALDVERLQRIANRHVIEVFGDGLSDGRWQAIAAEYARKGAESLA